MIFQKYSFPILIACLCFVLFAGFMLRFVWVQDMEYKDDERKLFITSQEAVRTGVWPSLGMISSTGVRNPATSDWILIALTKVFSIKTPVGLGQAVMGLNSLALLLLLGFAWLRKKSLQREVWLWTFSLAAVSPFAILFQRKIWGQSLLPFFCVLLFIAVFYRRERWAAALWGFLTVFLGQIHMASIFFTFSVVAVFLLAERRLQHWPYFLLASLAAMPPLFPWVSQAVGGPSASSGVNPIYGWGEVFRLRFWRYWFTEPLGLKLTYSLGAGHFQEYLRYPGNTYLVGLSHYLSLVLGLGVYFAFLYKILRSRFKVLKRIWLRFRTEVLLFIAAFLLYGLILSLYTINVLVYRHYLITLYPLTFLFLALLALVSFSKRWGRAILALSVCLQLFMSSNFLYYIHKTQGTTNADSDYGTAYQYQEQKEYFIDENGDLREKF